LVSPEAQAEEELVAVDEHQGPAVADQRRGSRLHGSLSWTFSFCLLDGWCDWRQRCGGRHIGHRSGCPPREPVRRDPRIRAPVESATPGRTRLQIGGEARRRPLAPAGAATSPSRVRPCRPLITPCREGRGAVPHRGAVDPAPGPGPATARRSHRRPRSGPPRARPVLLMGRLARSRRQP